MEKEKEKKSIAQKVFEAKMERHSDILRKSVATNGRQFEALSLSNNTDMRRELFEDGSKGPVEVTMQLNTTPFFYAIQGSRGFTIRAQKEGFVGRSGDKLPIGPVNRLKVLARVALGKPGK